MKKNSEITYKEMYLQDKSFKAVNDFLPQMYTTLEKVFAEKYDELIFTGCGTSFYAALTAASVFSYYNAVPSKAVPCSELYYFPETYVKNRKVLILPITRKSFTTEVRMAIDKVRSFPNVKSLAITCDPASADYNDYMALSPDTAEDSVIMTRSFTSMIYIATVIALFAAGKKHEIAKTAHLDTAARDLLPKMDTLAKKVIAENPQSNLFITLGQGAYYGVACECMNKMKEMGLTNSEAYYSLEYRHGPMSLVDKNTLIFFLVSSHTAEYDAKLLTEMKSYGAVTVAIGENAAKYCPEAHYALDLAAGLSDAQNAPLIGFIGQFAGFYIAEQKNIDADTPRNLAQAIVLK